MGKLLFPSGATGGKGFIADVPTGKTSPSVVNQSAFLPADFSYCAVKPWSSTCTSMPPGGSLPGGRFSSAAAGDQRNTPELPPLLRWRHSSESSRLVTGRLLRITPTGFPVHRTEFSCQVQVPGSPLTFSKSSAVRSRQPGPPSSITIEAGPAAPLNGRGVSAAYAFQASSTAPIRSSPLWNRKRWCSRRTSPGASVVVPSGSAGSYCLLANGLAAKSP